MSRYRAKAAVLIKPSTIQIQEFEVPSILHNEVLIQIHMAGVCGSDLHLYGSPKPFGDFSRIPWSYPTILGHENFGTVIEIGAESDAKDAGGMPLEEGDRVAFSTRGRPKSTNILLTGWARGWATYSICSEGSKFYKFDKDVPGEVIVLTEPMSIAQRAIMRAQQSVEPYSMRGLFPGASIVIQGLGPIGILTLIVAKLAAVEQIIAVDMSDFRLNMAKDFGADVLINPSNFEKQTDFITKIQNLSTYGLGPDVVFEAAGVPAALQQAIAMVKRGGTIIEVGHWTDRGTIPINPFQICIKDLDILGSAGACSAWPGGDWELSRRILRTNYKKVPFEKIVSHKFTLENVEEALTMAKEKQVMKAVIIPS